MYRRRSQCCPGYFESGDLCVRECLSHFAHLFSPKSAQSNFSFFASGYEHNKSIHPLEQCPLKPWTPHLPSSRDIHQNLSHLWGIFATAYIRHNLLLSLLLRLILGLPIYSVLTLPVRHYNTVNSIQLSLIFRPKSWVIHGKYIVLILPVPQITRQLRK